ncbi:MAG: hypothetical protein FJX74_21325, partial [Armatimonadetes bacterium]|nr:hypothetical protein [Armatimonadota bacterium]
MRTLAFAFLALSVASATSAQDGSWKDAVLLYAPMDGTADATQARGDGRAAPVGPTSFLPGRRGQALSLPEAAGCSYAVDANFSRESGSFCAWVSLNRDTAVWDTQKGSWYQWLLGVRDVPADPANRSDLRVFFDRTLTLQFATPTPAPTYGMIAIPDLGWTAGTWHHVGLTWRAREMR